jgi:epoxyqueuosine reductase
MNRLENMPEDDYAKMGRRILGCDTCQEVCPKNAALTTEQLPPDMAEYMMLENLLTKPDFDGISKHAQISERYKPSVKQLAALAAANTKRKDLLPLVEALIDSEDELLKKIARWAAKSLQKI